MSKLRMILGLPFIIVGYVLAFPTFGFCKLACVIRGKDWPFVQTQGESK